MIDPTNITNYNLSDSELEEHILFWICAAGKNGVTAAKCLDEFIGSARYNVACQMENERQNGVDAIYLSPFQLIRELGSIDYIADKMKEAGIGCYNTKAKSFYELAHSCLDLKTCTVNDLENIHGIGPKTARCFMIHSRPDQKLAGLDRHILSFLSDKGYNVPVNTPPAGAKYRKIERYFIKEAEKAGKSIAELDLEVWNRYRGS